VTPRAIGGDGRSPLEEEGAVLRRYLLGEASEHEAARLERAYLGSDAALEELRAHEDELIEDYLAGALDPPERESFERHFLSSPGRFERLLFIRALRDRAARPHVPRTHPWRWARAAAAAAAVVAAAGVLVARAVAPVDTARSVRPSPPPEAAPSEPVPPAPASVASRPVSLRLEVPAVRGSSDLPVLEAGAADVAVLEAPLDPREPFTAYRGRLAAPDGSDVLLSPWQPNRGERSLRVIVPVASLRAGRHVLVVEGTSGTAEVPVESYVFRVLR
jgi:hypothetical protein